MAWFDTYVNAPAVVITGYEEDDYLTFVVNGTTVTQWKRTSTGKTTEYRGLTLAAAEAGVTALKAEGVQVSYRQENPAGAYTLVKEEFTTTAYSEV